MITTQMTKIIMNQDINGNQLLFGGRLMEWIDACAGSCCRQYVHGDNCVLATAGPIEFLKPLHLNQIVCLEAQVVWTGNTSMECCVRTFVDQNDGQRVLANQAALVFVHVDSMGKPIPVTPLVPQTPEENANWQAADRRQKNRLASRL